MKVELWPVKRVTPYERNPRRISDRAVDMVAKSIDEFGWQQPLVVDTDGVLIVGHVRLAAAKSLGIDQVPVVVADLTPERARAYRIADNRTSDYTDWDVTALLEELDELAGTGLEEILGLADWQEILANQADDEMALGLSGDASEQYSTIELTVVCGSEDVRREVEALLAEVEGVIDVRRGYRG
jgi:hypothetical protein